MSINADIEAVGWFLCSRYTAPRPWVQNNFVFAQAVNALNLALVGKGISLLASISFGKIDRPLMIGPKKLQENRLSPIADQTAAFVTLGN